MTGNLGNRLTIVWIFLSAITVFSWWFSARHGAAAFDVGATVAIAVSVAALVKSRLVLWHFMEVHDGPAWLRWTCTAWLVVFFATVVGLYLWLP
jgi:Prokaryotic Cytochrome C oxidase subunit IV